MPAIRRKAYLYASQMIFEGGVVDWQTGGVTFPKE